MSETTYTLRKLKSTDLSAMTKIVTKIGAKQFKECLQSEDVMNMIAKMNEDGGMDANAVGLAVVMDIASIIIANYASAEKEIIGFLSELSGMSVEDITELDMSAYAEMIIDVVKKEEFKDFIGVVSKLFK